MKGNDVILRGIDFGPVLCASGAMGFFGEGCRHHRILGLLGLDFTGCTFVAKTTTLNPRTGNMPLEKDGITPREFFPKCVKAYPCKGIILNAVGLSGPGAGFLLETGRWQKKTMPFFISFMSVGKTAAERADELRKFVNSDARSFLPKQGKSFFTYFGADFYGLPRNTGMIKLIEEDWTVPNEYEGIVPFLAGKNMYWKVA